MRILLTGVSGFIGSRLATLLAACGGTVFGTFVGSASSIPGVQAFSVDLLDGEALKRIIRESTPEIVVHLGGLSHVGSSWSAMGDYFRVNVLGTETVLEAAGTAPVLLASSAEVYGEVPEGEQPLTEDRTPAPNNPYALTKAAAERLVLAANGTIVRLFNVVGAGQSSQFALPGFAAQLRELSERKGRRVLEVGNLAARRDFVHLEDAVEGLKAVIERGGKGKIYNLGSGEICAIGEALEQLIEISGVRVEIVQDPARVRPVDIPLLRADNRRLRSLGWEPRQSLSEALEDVWREANA